MQGRERNAGIRASPKRRRKAPCLLTTTVTVERQQARLPPGRNRQARMPTLRRANRCARPGPVLWSLCKTCLNRIILNVTENLTELGVVSHPMIERLDLVGSGYHAA